MCFYSFGTFLSDGKVLFQNQLRKASLTEDDAFAFLKADNDGDYITYSGFCEALRQVLELPSNWDLFFFLLSSCFLVGEHNYYSVLSFYSSI